MFGVGVGFWCDECLCGLDVSCSFLMFVDEFEVGWLVVENVVCDFVVYDVVEDVVVYVGCEVDVVVVWGIVILVGVVVFVDCQVEIGSEILDVYVGFFWQSMVRCGCSLCCCCWGIC